MNSLIIASNIIKRLVREIPALGFLIIFPIIGAVLALAMCGSDSVIKIGMANVSTEEHQIIQVIEGTGKYDIEVFDAYTIEEKVKNKKIKAGIILPDNFDDKLKQRTMSKVKLIGRQNDSTTMELNGLIDGYIGAVYKGETIINPQPSSNKKENSIETPRTAMGFLTMFILLFLGSGMGVILEDKRKKTFMRTFCAPIREHEMVLGNLLANVMLGIIQIILFIAATKYLLGIEWKISLLSVFIIMFIYLVAVTGLSIGVMGFIRNSQIYTVVNSLLATVTCMLGGSFFPIEYMNDTMKKVANFMPQKWVMESFDKLAVGGTFTDIQVNILILLLFGVAFFTFGVKVLRPMEEDL